MASRAGRGTLTGVDRVELAYLRHFLDGPVPCFGLIRTVLGVLLLDRGGMEAFRRRLMGEELFGSADLLSRLTRSNPDHARAESDLRYLALARAPLSLTALMLRRRLPRGTSYLNTGHANLHPMMMAAIRRGLRGKIGVLVHDTIPLDHPDLCRPGASDSFGRKMRAVADNADLVIFTTRDAQDRAEPHLARLGRVPLSCVASLGADITRLGSLPREMSVDRPFFLALGTIEPRKNLGLLLDVWQQMHSASPEARIPRLVIAGNRGWSHEVVTARLGQPPFNTGSVVELHGLDDGAVAALMAAATALLVPSLAEGFGLPGVEAAALGCPVICSDLPVFREVLKDYPIYLPMDDRYAWLETITVAVAADRQARAARRALGWDSHFDKVLTAI